MQNDFFYHHHIIFGRRLPHKSLRQIDRGPLRGLQQQGHHFTSSSRKTLQLALRIVKQYKPVWPLAER